ncbi:BamA/TamA family outer membrane protein [Leptolyngbya sp. AN02str]|uniref:BamA/TamA family outer membrane protein n=1 Tax=Leptolyngbya sp. AN02str TaxID=3423363 RepID=UPI003D320270
MSSTPRSSVSLAALLVAGASFATATASWAQTADMQALTKTADLTQVAENIHTLKAEQVSTRAQDLQSSTPLPELTQVPTQNPEGGTSPTVVTPPDEGLRFTTLPPSAPTVLQGSARPRITRTPFKSGGLSAYAGVRQRVGRNGSINLIVEGGESIVGLDLGYTQMSRDPRRGFGVNVFSTQSYVPAFRGGDREVNLLGGDTPWVDRLGAGAEIFFPIGDEIDSAFGVSYQRVAVRDDLFGGDAFGFDELGNALTVDSDGTDDLVTLNFAAYRDRRDNGVLSTEGNFLRVGIDQGFVVSGDDATFTRVGANFVQYVPFNLFGFAEGPRTLVLNLQGGHIFGDVPPYEGFNVGGDRSVRGFRGGGIGTGRSFLIAVAEYRFPIAQLNVFSEEIDLRGALFVDFGTDFDTSDEVIGQPAIAREKPGTGFGFGAGLQAALPIGFARVEYAFTDDDDTRFIVTLGDRF